MKQLVEPVDTRAVPVTLGLETKSTVIVRIRQQHWAHADALRACQLAAPTVPDVPAFLGRNLQEVAGAAVKARRRFPAAHLAPEHACIDAWGQRHLVPELRRLRRALAYHRDAVPAISHPARAEARIGTQLGPRSSVLR